MSKGIGLLVIGTEGVGKTTFGAEFPKPIKAESLYESGVEDFIEMGIFDPKLVHNTNHDNYHELMLSIKNATEPTLLIDSTSGYQRLLFDYIIETKHDGDEDSFYAYYKGPRQEAPKYASDFCNLLENKRRQGQHVIVLAHAKDTTVKNPRGVDYTTTDIDLDEGIREVFKKWAANILFMTVDAGISQVTKMKNKVATEAKMMEEDLRVIFTQKSLVHSAKNKLNLPPVIPMGSSPENAYDNFCKHLPPLYKDQLID